MLIKVEFFLPITNIIYNFVCLKFVVMKKFVVIVLMALFAMALLGSCRSVENCPAYSEASSVEIETVDVA